MSEPAMALGGAASATVTEQPVVGMITVRAHLETQGAAIAAVVGAALPSQRGITSAGDRRLAWMSPDELLVILPLSEVAGVVSALTEALAGGHAMVIDVSHMRSMFAIAGDAPRDVVAKLVPADLHPDSFGAGELRRTRLAQVPCAFWLEGAEIRLICFRSVARYAFDVLAEAADTPVGHFPAT